MKIIKTISVLLICLALLVSGVVSAAMPCCMTNPDQPNSNIQMDHTDMAMPCHKTADSNHQDTTNCDSCDCQHCVNIGALLQYPFVKDIAVSSVAPFDIESIYSYQPEGIFQPPKLIS